MRQLTLIGFVVVFLFASLATSHADTGVLKPYFGNRQMRSDALSLAKMEVRVRIDHGVAQVSILQIHQSHSFQSLEGRFRMIIPEMADISSFAIWDELVRIPGVIMEKQKAKKLFEDITRQTIDPGLLESDEEETVVNEFTVRIFPIPPYGTKRMEMIYNMPVPIERGLLDFILSMKPDDAGMQKVGELIVEIEVAAGLPIKQIAFHGANLVPQIAAQTADSFTARYEGRDVMIDEDIAFTAELELPDTRLDLVAFRDVEHVDWSISPDGGGHFRDDSGYYLARILFAPRESTSVGKRHVIFVVDGSLSMLGDKLNRTVELLGELGGRLAPGDAATLLFANTEVRIMPGPARPVNAQWLSEMDTFLRSQRLAGGIDLAGALTKSTEAFSPTAENFVVLLSDGYATAGELRPLKIAEAIKATPLGMGQGRLFAVGVGDDANQTLLTDLAALSDGSYTWCADTADTLRLAETVAARMAASVIRQIELTFGRPGAMVDSYPTQIASTFAGSEARVVGRYKQSGAQQVTLRYQADNEPEQTRTFKVELPEKTTEHEGIRRVWAKARVTYLLERIRREGEKKEWVDEIVALSKRFTFVTPYTSFLAAPRALLRPRVIRPGDPLLRVRTDADIASVTALFPFGLVAPLTYLADEDVWQVRFLAPPEYPDGEYVCQLLLVDREGRQTIVDKSFVLDGVAPVVKPAVAFTLKAGGKARIAVYADADTRRLYARLPFAAGASLRWSEQDKASVGYLDIPAGAPSGPVQVEIYAEDFAHNVSRTLLLAEVTHE